MAWITLGVVSNVWNRLLPEHALADLCREAVARGFAHVELRQGSLGSAEHTLQPGEPPLPDAERLEALAAEVPQLGFNLAIELPVTSQPVSPTTPLFATAVEAARRVGGDEPLLRLVDLTPADRPLPSDAIEARGEDLAALAIAAHRGGVALALENSRQPVSIVRRIIETAHLRLADRAPTPRLCWDPANMLAAVGPSEDPVAVAADLHPWELALFHFKQLRSGVLQHTVEEGDLDWFALLSTLRARGYRGPALFEIPADECAWEHLERSRAYIQELLDRLE